MSDRIHLQRPGLYRLPGHGLGHWAVGFLGMVALSLMLEGCATYRQNAGKLLASTALAVDAAMRGWREVVHMGKATPEQEAKVKAAFEKYQLAQSAAEAAYTLLMTMGDKSAWPTASAQLTESSTGLTSLIQSFKQ